MFGYDIQIPILVLMEAFNNSGEILYVRYSNACKLIGCSQVVDWFRPSTDELQLNQKEGMDYGAKPSSTTIRLSSERESVWSLVNCS